MENSNNSNSLQNYQIIRELGRHNENIYINYIAQNNINNKSVILTNFILPQSSINTNKNIDYQKILELLQSLNHPGIPPYLDCFESEDGFCFVQEYPLSEPIISTNKWMLEDIKKIAISALDILIYLQEQISFISHNQIRPDNLLIDSNFQVYLINFGFAQFENINCPLYQIMNQSKGFIPPEQKRGKKLTKNSDFYSLGVTLSCLITGTEADKINSLIGQDGTFNLQGLISNKMSLTWIEWLENIVAINPIHRYPDAIAVGSMTSLIIIVGFIGLGSDVDLIVGFIAGLIVSCTAGMMIKFYLEKKSPKMTTITLALLTAIFGISFGIDLTFSNGNSLLLLIILGTGLPLILMVLNPYWQYQKQLNNYRRKEPLLIKS